MNKAFLKKILPYFSEVWFLWLLCLIFNIITFFVIRYKIHPSSAQTFALHYNILVGVDWRGDSRNLYYIPAIGLVITAVNFTFYKVVGDRENFLSFLSAFISLIVQFILLASVLFLASVN